MLIEKFWVVTKPTKDSSIDDILFECDIKSIGLQYLGGLRPSEVVGAYTDYDEALLVALYVISIV